MSESEGRSAGPSRDTEPDAVRIALVDPKSGDAQWCLEQYFDELRQRFEGGFDPALSVAPDVEGLTPPDGAFLVAVRDGDPVGCGAVRVTAPGIGYIKRMWIDRAVRGQGLGRRMLTSLEHAARDLGCHTVQLETNRSLREAIRLYRDTGYREVPAFNAERYAHHWFEKRLT